MEEIVECLYRQFQQVESIYAELYGMYHMYCYNVMSLAIIMQKWRDMRRCIQEHTSVFPLLMSWSGLGS